MTEKLDLYKCNICGNMVQVILTGEGELVCCGQPMELLSPKTHEEGKDEFHIPVYKTDDNGFTSIQVGKELHPMIPEHHIEFIERISEDKMKLSLEYLKVNNDARMELQNTIGKESALDYCNIHGLWEGHND